MISIDSLTVRYGAFTAVDNVSFTARPGRVTGFLGPNGAGKSTTMRVMVGLTRPTSGSASISGRPFADLPNPGLEVGVLLDASAQHAGRTGREILTIAQRTMGLPSARVEQMLHKVSLTSTEADRRVRNYSLGMRQRLGIATALIGDPEVLILDEPANGLDPAGIRWMRGLLKGYADRGGTVLLSSHLLHEVEQIADEMILIGHGRIVAQGDRRSLLANAAGSPTTLVASLDNAALGRQLSADGHLVEPLGEGLRVTASTEQVGRAALSAGVVLTDLRSGGAGLEDLFLELTSTTQRDGVPAHAQPHEHMPALPPMPPVDSPTPHSGGHA
jgi:ABC-2 type transport system ATP-binding protein